MKFTEYPQGSPCWIDLGTSDLEAAKSFYAGLFGWDTPPGDPQYGGYTLAHKGPDAVAGLGPLMAPEQSVAWNSYFAAADCDATLAAVTAAGGAVVAPGMDIGDQGRMAVCADPTGAVFGIWQAGVFPGAQVATEPDTWSWNELRTTDAAGAASFYATVFGVETEVGDVGGVEYTLLKVDDRRVAGIMSMTGLFPPDVPAHWMTMFSVAELEESTATVEKLGGQSIGPVGEAEGIGRWIAVADPQGGMFTIVQNA